jgi:PAS domain S-box-containing protein
MASEDIDYCATPVEAVLRLRDSAEDADSQTTSILMVDDQPANLLALEAIFSGLGHNLVKTLSGQEALRLLENRDFAVVLLDVQMQGLDGFKTAKVIRSRERSKHTPIIFLTAYQDDRFPVEEAYALGAVDYLVKPVLPVVLRAKVTGFVELFEKTQKIQRQAEQLRQMERRVFEQRLARENALLRESETRFRAIIENSFDAVVLIGADATALYASPGLTRMLGTPVQEFVGRNVFERMHPDDLAKTTGIFAQLLQQPGATLSAEFRYGHSDGSWRWIDGTGMNLLAEPGVRAIVGNFHDTTPQKQAEQSLAQLAAIVESSEDAILSKTLDGIITSWNAGAERLYGYTADEVVGKSVSLLVPEEHPNELPMIMERLRRGERIELYETVRVRKDGRRVSVSVRISPLRDASGNLTGASMIARDITERLKIEEALRESNRRKDEFLAMLAHELRNPLAPIRNAAYIVRMLGSTEDRLRRSGEMLDRQVRHLSHLVDDLLEVSRVTSGKINLHKEPLELATVVAWAVETSRPLIDARSHKLSVTLPPETLWLEGDRTRLMQVVANLLNNAAKYTPEKGQIWLTVAEKRGMVEVRVRDTGVGIAATLLPHVFDLFRQGDRSLARSEGGLGIGLTLVKSLVEMHGGSVQALSEGPGKGSEFILRLPVLKRTTSPPPEAGDGELRNAPAPPRRVLIVDDNADAVESLALLLKMDGHEVRTAYDGSTALSAVQEFQPGAVLLDIGLPGMDGYEVARRLRGEVAWQGLLVALTGYGQEEDVRRSREAGFDAHLLKPAEHTAVQHLLAQSSAASDTAASLEKIDG